eukprot:Protomagalhaensia_wolfi_Nauph_80__268@NODE_1150_length_1697_cov_5_096502_g878_i0_p1_GENE_NODE_1150_length_1697_cov_5_096502_g878_i0NODE_1150_length_1697_cov_5_096502_g878_i0_p1_ORF_typecomplete_len422_score77_22Orn_Arg_deC_N/PF02784_16/6_1e68Orn_DAP_Arg_deC/PF00278_22/4_8e40Ala_racemase_N/PF01168_20/2_4e05_NODE_1150_length_1697_cov_5_096502_g878_i04311696
MTLALAPDADFLPKDFKAPCTLIGEAFRKRLEFLHSLPDDQPLTQEPFFVADLGTVYHQHIRWVQQLPNVTPFYAVKCNPDIQVIRLLAQLGAGFDCASKAEMELVLEAGVSVDRIVYANPVKGRHHLAYATSHGVKRMTFDNKAELQKISMAAPLSELLLRISTDDSASQCRLSQKFGASLSSVPSLLKTVKQLGLKVVGVAFHVGSNASDPTALRAAIRDAATVYQIVRDCGLPPLEVLDIGGGFSDATFESMASIVRSAVNEFFPMNQPRLVAEPGRFYVAAAFSLAACVLGRRQEQEDDDKSKLYLSDGVYGAFSCIIFDHQHPEPQVLQQGQTFSDTSNSHKPVEYSLWGPTCDGLDCISSSCRLPAGLDTGDWLWFPNMGAYTSCSTTSFNGFPSARTVVYVSSEPEATALLSQF